MPANGKAVPPCMAGRPRETASKQQAHTSQFSRFNKEIDWFFLGVLAVVDAVTIAAWLALVFGGRTGL